MKLIEKKEQKKVPELIFGAKYKLLHASEDLEKGETVVLVEHKPDIDGDLKVYSEDDWDHVKPEQLQLITDENAVDKDVLVAGNEYFVTGKSKYGKDLYGKKVTLVPDDEFPFTGEYVVVEGAGYHGVLVKTTQLTPVKAAKKEVETTYVIEFTESELKMLYASVGTSNNNQRNELLSSEKLNPDNSLQHFKDVELYRGLREFLQGEDK